MKKLLQAIGKAFNLTIVTNEEYSKLTEEPTIVNKEITKPTTLLTYNEIVEMLTEYDNTRLYTDKETNLTVTKGLKFEDSRVSTFDFTEIKNYIAYIEDIATKKGITLKGLSFIKGVYTKNTTTSTEYIGHENLMYLPTTIIDGNEVLIDLLQTTNQETIRFSDMLAKQNYNWRNDSEKTSDSYEKKQTNSYQPQLKSTSSGSSGVANRTNLKPPL